MTCETISLLDISPVKRIKNNLIILNKHESSRFRKSVSEKMKILHQLILNIVATHSNQKVIKGYMTFYVFLVAKAQIVHYAKIFLKFQKWSKNCKFPGISKIREEGVEKLIKIPRWWSSSDDLKTHECLSIYSLILYII